MPIKFRCQHCSQLLGISRSRAHAVVDCPRCGRTLRVPGPDGHTASLPDPGTEVRGDPQLMTALSALTGLGTNEATEVGNPSAQSQHEVGRVETQQNPPAVKRVEQTPAAAESVVETESDFASTVERFDSSSDRGSVEVLADSLATLIEDAPSAGESTTDGSADHASRVRLRRSVWVGVCILGSIAVFVAGIAIGRYSFGPEEAASELAADVPDKQNGEEATDNNLQPVAAQTSRVVRGTVLYRDANGSLVPDMGALVLALPVTREGRVLLNARSLTRSAGHPDRRAMTAALRALHGDLASADAHGQFQLAVPDATPVRLVIVSRHLERADDAQMGVELQKLLATWFDSTSHLCGRLAARDMALPEESTDITVRIE